MNDEIDFQQLSNEELSGLLSIAKSDLEKAAKEEPNSEWHEACFAAVFLMATEQYNRKH